MSSSTHTPVHPVTSTIGAAAPPAVWKHGIAAAVIASVVVTALAALASAGGISFATDGESIPIAGFAQLTLIFSLLGVAIAAVLARKARRPRTTFVRTTVVLTVLSCVPDVTFGFDAESAVALIALHLVAAAIVVPALALRLSPTGGQRVE